MSLLILDASFLLHPLFPFLLYIINITSLLLALGRHDGHKEMPSSVPDS